ncbi:olfactory receptor-like protein OLF4 [Suncus etruscus]|uniref:olfactory receptor-like protein OLF4 n=1 Tax=Suncus etruscus TaxID=109475 RepID=UPI002110E0FA|nr:olfactory receptor-like protein OLF4 [Suncus etruscus]
MAVENDTEISQFILLGFSKNPELQLVLYVMFLTMYLITILGNLLIIMATSSDPHLHTPMYFFLANLSLNDICYVSTTVPKMLVNTQIQRKGISYKGCMSQIFFFVLFASLDDFLLTVMAYDRFVAICHPLHYTVIMNPRLCGLMILGCWLLSVLNASLEVLVVLRLSFCTEVEIPHFFCELNMVVKLACSDTFLNNVVMYGFALLLGGGPLLCIIYSYCKIASSIRGISSAQGKYKAFSTCASHLSVVALFYFTSMGVYLSSEVSESAYTSTVASVLYTVITPMLNPFIYSLRNKDIKKALNTLFVQGTTKRSVRLH